MFAENYAFLTNCKSSNFDFSSGVKVEGTKVWTIPKPTSLMKSKFGSNSLFPVHSTQVAIVFEFILF